MAMDRDELLKRIVTAAEYIESNQDRMSEKTKSEAMRRYDALCADLEELKEEERKKQEAVPQDVQKQINTIREMLKPVKRPKGEAV